MLGRYTRATKGFRHTCQSSSESCLPGLGMDGDLRDWVTYGRGVIKLNWSAPRFLVQR